jgi:hypothetical protein
MALASDLNNPEFVGATDPDARLHVTFYRRPVQNDFRTQIEGRPIFDEIEMVKIYIPGDTTTVIDAPVREDHKRRFPRHWAYYESTQGKENLQAGTPLSQWPLLGPAQVEELKALKFTTVESIATASDLQLGRMGSAGGMAATALRDKAVRYLTVANDTSAVDHAKAELEAIKAAQAEKDAQHAAEMAELKAQMIALAAAVQPKRGPGRPKKAKTETEAV